MDIVEVTLEDVLRARELRAHSQRRLIREYSLPLLCLNMNIAGPVKRNSLIDLAFTSCLSALKDRLGNAILHLETVDANTGLEAILVCSLEAHELKAIAVELESRRPVGRLFDLDVIGTDGVKLSRDVPRACLVCGGPAAPCARSRAHGLPAIQAATQALLREFAADHLAQLAVDALIDEVELTPKPGLVDRRNSGAHRDMDLPMFYRSARCLAPYFHRAVELGMEKPDCMDALRAAGIEAEEVMLQETGGVNTHRGAVYAFGLLLAALGSYLIRGGDVFLHVSSLAQAGSPPSDVSHGGKVRLLYGAEGARGEALRGFPTARETADTIADVKENYFSVFLKLLSEVEDTNLLHRGGIDGLRFVQGAAREILAGPESEYRAKLLELDDLCIEKGLSPGGSADIFALSLLLHRTRSIWADRRSQEEQP